MRGDDCDEAVVEMSSKLKSVGRQVVSKPRLIGLGVWITAYVLGAMGIEALLRRRKRAERTRDDRRPER